MLAQSNEFAQMQVGAAPASAADPLQYQLLLARPPSMSCSPGAGCAKGRAFAQLSSGAPAAARSPRCWGTAAHIRLRGTRAVQVREEEGVELDNLNNSEICPYELKAAPDHTHSKVAILLQVAPPAQALALTALLCCTRTSCKGV